MRTGQMIQMLRKQNGMTQNELAERLYVSRDLVAKWETGSRRIDRQTAEKLASLFGVPSQSLWDKDEELLRELSECVPDGKEASDSVLVGQVNAFLRTLNERDRHVFLMRYYYRKSVAEIADGYGLKESSVYSALSRTRNKLKNYLSEALS